MKLFKNGILSQLKKICPPAMLYLVLSIFSFLGILMQNCSISSRYVIGDMSAKTPCHNAWIFVGKAIYIIFWTWLLNMLCSKGFTTVSWFLVLLPFIAMFMILGLIMIILMKTEKEGIGDYSSIQRSWRGQIKSGITADDIYLVEEEKKKDKIKEKKALSKLIKEKEADTQQQQIDAENKATAGFTIRKFN
jgi:hypothetical protein